MLKLKTKAKKAYKPLLALSLLVVLAISSTTAYFTASQVAPDTVFTSGEVKVELAQLEVALPGETYELYFTVTNTGSVGEYIKGYLGGEWGDSVLDSENAFSIISVERLEGNDWQPISPDTLNFGDEFYLRN